MRVIVLLWSCVWVQAMGAEPHSSSHVDRVQEFLSSMVLESCDRFDWHLHRRFFPADAGLHGYDEEEFPIAATVSDLQKIADHKGSLIRLSPAIELEESGGVDYDVRFDAKIRLRRFKERVNLVINNSDEDDEVLTGITDQATRQRRNENQDEEEAGLYVRLMDKTRFKIDVGAGAKFKPEPIPKVKSKFKAIYAGRDWQVELAETIFWESDDRFGEKTQFQYSKRLGDEAIFRSISAATWSETTRGLSFGQSVLFSHRFCSKSTIQYKAGASGYTEPSIAMDEYNVRLGYTRQIYRNWLYFEVEPGVDFRRDNNYDAIPLVTFRLHMLFGDLAGHGL
jgi:hypothetical protein